MSRSVEPDEDPKPRPPAAAVAAPSRLCRLDELPDNAGRGFVTGEGREQREIFLIRRGGAVYAYRNVCPHKGTNLDWSPDQFMDETGDFIQCATHGARFIVEDGTCIAGPCLGARLQALPICVAEDGSITLAGG